MKHVCIYGKRCRACKFTVKASDFHKASWPILSDAMGVHPSQVPEAIEEAKRLGIPTDYTKDGSAVITSLHHRDQLARALKVPCSPNGLVDRSPEITEPKFRTMQERSPRYSSQYSH